MGLTSFSHGNLHVFHMLSTWELTCISHVISGVSHVKFHMCRESHVYEATCAHVKFMWFLWKGNILMIFGIKEKSIILNQTMSFWLSTCTT